MQKPIDPSGRFYGCFFLFWLFTVLLVSQISYGSSDFEIHYTKGVKAHAEGRFDEAKEELVSALKINPKSTQAAYAMGTVYLETADYVSALKQFRTVYKENREREKINYKIGLTYYKKGEFARAAEFFKEELKISKDSEIRDECHFYLGKVYEKNDQAELAQKEFAQVSSKTLAKPLEIKKKRWFFNAYPGFQYDTNVGLISKGVAVPPDISGKASPRIYLSMTGGFVPLQMPRHTLAAGYRYYHGFNLTNKLHAFDIDQHRFALDSVCLKSLNRGALRFYNTLFYELSMISRSYNFYNQSFGWKPRAEIIWNRNTATEFRLPLSYDDFYRSAFPEDNRDAIHLEAGIEQSWRFNGRKTRIYIAFDYGRNFAKGRNFDYNAYMPSLGYEAVDLVVFSKMNFDFTYARRDFVNFSPAPKREDNTFIVMINFNRRLSKYFDLNLNNSFMYNESIAGYSYRRNITSLILGINI